MKIDAVGLLCPEPIMMLHRAIQKISEGEKVELYATDPSTETVSYTHLTLPTKA